MQYIAKEKLRCRNLNIYERICSVGILLILTGLIHLPPFLCMKLISDSRTTVSLIATVFSTFALCSNILPLFQAWYAFSDGAFDIAFSFSLFLVSFTGIVYASVYKINAMLIPNYLGLLTQSLACFSWLFLRYFARTIKNVRSNLQEKTSSHAIKVRLFLLLFLGCVLSVTVSIFCVMGTVKFCLNYVQHRIVSAVYIATSTLPLIAFAANWPASTAQYRLLWSARCQNQQRRSPLTLCSLCAVPVLVGINCYVWYIYAFSVLELHFFLLCFVNSFLSVCNALVFLVPPLVIYPKRLKFDWNVLCPYNCLTPPVAEDTSPMLAAAVQVVSEQDLCSHTYSSDMSDRGEINFNGSPSSLNGLKNQSRRYSLDHQYFIDNSDVLADLEENKPTVEEVYGSVVSPFILDFFGALCVDYTGFNIT